MTYPKTPSGKSPMKKPEKTPQQSYRSSKQVLCSGRDKGGIKSCRIKSHPTVPGGRYCSTHQKLCRRCEGSPRHRLTEKCPSCMMRWRKEEQEKNKKN